jgi:hypothetical protein
MIAVPHLAFLLLNMLSSWHMNVQWLGSREAKMTREVQGNTLVGELPHLSIFHVNRC